MPATEKTTAEANTGRTGPVRALRITGRIAVTLVIVAGAALVVRFGTGELSRRAEATPAPAAAQATPVQTTPIVIAPGYDIRQSFVGQIEPGRTVSVTFELSGRLEDVLAEEGDSVRKGQLLATQDTSLLEAERTQLLASKSATEAQLLFAARSADRSTALSERGFATQETLDAAIARRDELAARITEIEAGLSNLDIRLSKSRIHAPFDGRITSRVLDGGETLAPGQPILEIVETNGPRFRVGVPLEFDEERLGGATIELDGRLHPARLVALRPDIEPVTRTRTALFTVEGNARSLFGQSARLVVEERIEAAGLWLPLVSLQEGLRGQWSVLTVDATDTVRAAPVEILHAEADRVFVRGAFPDGSRLIRLGPQRVTPGQRVATLSEE